MQPKINQLRREGKLPAEPMLLVLPHPETSAVKHSHHPESFLVPSETQQDLGATRAQKPLCVPCFSFVEKVSNFSPFLSPKSRDRQLLITEVRETRLNERNKDNT